jgi:hypothetical protein
MKRFFACVGFCGMVLGCARGPNVTSNQLPLRRVVIYRNGVGYFERAGAVDGSEVGFKMRQHAVGDFLATLAIVERGGSTVRSASFPIEVEDKYEPPPPVACPTDPVKCPEPTPKERKEKNPLRRVGLRLDGKQHDLAVGYVAETPVWRPSYRVVVNRGGKAELQSWGIVQNLSGEDWREVELVLVAGAPLAFESTLGNPITPRRPIVSDSGEVIAAMPEGVTSLERKPDQEVTRYVPEEQAPAQAEAMPKPAMPAPSGSGAGALTFAEKTLSSAGQAKAPAARRAMKVSAARDKDLGAPKEASMDLKRGSQQPAPPMAPPPPPVPSQAPSAPRNVSILAGVAIESGATRYSVPYLITVPDESATMVLLASEEVPGESVFLFAPEGGVSDSAQHPFRVARFTNSTSGLLERGPIAVFEKGSFLGQGMLDSLPPGATATVPFALERGVAIEQSSKYDERGARLYKIEGAQLTIERDSVTMTTYKMTNGTKEPGKMLVRHPRRPGTRLYRPAPGTEDNAALGNALVPISINPNGRAELVVDERLAQQRSIGWLEPLADDAVKAYLADSRSDRQAVAQLTAAWQIRQLWKGRVDEQSKLVTEREELERNLSQLHDSLKAIEKNVQAADLRQKLTRKLGEASTRIDQITKRLVEVEVGMREQEVRFRDAINDIRIMSVPPPKE